MQAMHRIDQPHAVPAGGDNRGDKERHNGNGNDEAVGVWGKNEKERKFLTNLFRELFQTEQSARKHPRVEAKRLGDVPPARAMLAVAAHADSVLPELRELVKERRMVAVMGAKKVGSVFSVLRDRFADLLLSQEKSYRGTILGMRHGIDLITLIERVAAAQGDTALTAWCARWLETRKPLVETTAAELAWFAAHPDFATEPVKHSALGRAMQLLVAGVEKAAESTTPHTPSKA